MAMPTYARMPLHYMDYLTIVEASSPVAVCHARLKLLGTR